MNNAEQMHVLASAGISPSDSDIEIDDDDLRHYRKQAKKYFQKKKRRRGLSSDQCRTAPSKPTPVIIITVNGTFYPINTAAWDKLKGARRFFRSDPLDQR